MNVRRSVYDMKGGEPFPAGLMEGKEMIELKSTYSGGDMSDSDGAERNLGHDGCNVVGGAFVVCHGKGIKRLRYMHVCVEVLSC